SAADLPLVLFPFVKRIDASQRQEDGDHQGARAAQSRGWRQVAGESDVGTAKGSRKVLSDSTRDGHRIVRPVSGARTQLRAQVEINAVEPAYVGHSHQSVFAAGSHNTESAF